ncbi:fibronectin type III domain-containing protein [Azohydromonas aeria]|uniref:fibronectin type III domain-containing protein n=1 Tax=Azohydromonas aeria TaxID=2590212 RepID=UPI0012FA04C0|nr:fibronectin type III domain-containing protein [Azohydromonas aeria]
MQTADLVKETATGTGPFTLGGAAQGFRTFAAAFPSGATGVMVAVSEPSTGARLTGLATISDNTLTITSTETAVGTFGAGAKEVVCTATAKQLRRLARPSAPTLGSIADGNAIKLAAFDTNGDPLNFTAGTFLAWLLTQSQGPGDLAAAGALAGTDIVTVTQGTTEVKTTLSALSTFFGAAGGGTSTPPGAPTGLTLGTATTSSQPLTWTAPSSTGTSAITDYTVQYAVAGSGSWQTFAHSASTATSITVTGLSAGTSYDYRVAAVSAAGSGSYSSTATGSTAAATGTPAGAPTALTLGTATTTTQPLSWTAGTEGSTATTDYIVQYRVTGSGSWLTFSDGTSTATSATVTGLTPGVSYDYQVAAVNGAGSSAYSTSVTGSTAAAAPGQVTGLTLGTATETTQPLTWTAPTANGSAITDYVIQYRVTGSGSWTTFADGTSTTTSATVTGLTASTSYDYQVAAVNGVGTGANSNTATGSTGAAVTAYTITGHSGTAVKSTFDASGLSTGSNGKKVIAPSSQFTLNVYWAISPAPASDGVATTGAYSGWVPSGTTPTTSDRAATQNLSSGLNAIVPMVKPSTVWGNNSNLYITPGSGTTTWDFIVWPAGGTPQVKGTLTVTGG